jgi:hypothetical protein
MVEESKEGKRGKLEGAEEKRREKGKGKEQETGWKKKWDEEKAEEEMEKETPAEWRKWVANWLSQILVEQSQLGKELAEVQREPAELWLDNHSILKGTGWLFDLFYHMEESNKRLDSKVEELVHLFVRKSDREEPEGLKTEKGVGKEGEEEESKEEEEEEEEPAVEVMATEDGEMEKGRAEKEGKSRGAVEGKEIEETRATEEEMEGKDGDGDVDMAAVE